MGKVFWLGALGVSEQRLHALQQKEFVQRARRSSVAGETEFAFKHVLVRDVAYGQIPRARAGAEASACRRVDRVARSSRGSRRDGRAPLRQRARACARGGPGPRRPRRPHAGALARCGRARADAERTGAGGGRISARRSRSPRRTTPNGPACCCSTAEFATCETLEGVDELTEARESLVRGRRPRGSRRSVADAGRHRVAGRQSRRDAERPRGRSASRRRGVAFPHPGRGARRGGALRDARRSAATRRSKLGREALALAEELGLEDLRAHALNTIGVSRADMGDRGGFDDLEESIEIASRGNFVSDLLRGHNNRQALYFLYGEIGEGPSGRGGHARAGPPLRSAGVRALRRGRALGGEPLSGR